MNNIVKTATALGAAALLTIAAAMPAQADSRSGSKECLGTRTAYVNTDSIGGTLAWTKYGTSITRLSHFNSGFGVITWAPFQSVLWSAYSDYWFSNPYGNCG